MAAIGTYVVAMAVLTLMDATIKWLSADYHTLQILAFRSLFGFIPVLAFVMVAQGGLSALGTRRPGAHLLRGLVITATAFPCSSSPSAACRSPMPMRSSSPPRCS